jgi:hypothetical protein
MKSYKITCDLCNEEIEITLWSKHYSLIAHGFLKKK